MGAPKLFVSYSWTNADHEAWVLRLATELRESGVDVVLDKWDLKEGHDAHAFMEQMVTNPDIQKVILVCDAAYVAKTDGRSGGVGTEAQIISAEIYAKQAQDKFAALVVERDANGSACLPVYYKSRIYIDFSDPSGYSDSFEQLLRWVFDKPLHVKPAIGQLPAFLSGGTDTAVLATSARFRRALDAVRGGQQHATAAVAEYLDSLAGQFENLRIVSGGADDFDDRVVESVDCFLPYRNEVIELFTALALYLDTSDTRRLVHRFFEKLIPYLDRPQNISSFHDWDFDNFRFIVHELFLHALAAYIRHERFDAAAYLLNTQYFLPGQSDYGRDVMVDFDVIRQYMKSLEHRNTRLKLARLSVRADMLKGRCTAVGVEFRQLMQADFVAFMNSEIKNPATFTRWWPETLVFVGHVSTTTEVFARSRSKEYFERTRTLLGIEAKDELLPLLKSYAAGGRKLPRWEFDSFSPRTMLGFDDLATRP
jgi:hypothetical protein